MTLGRQEAWPWSSVADFLPASSVSALLAAARSTVAVAVANANRDAAAAAAESPSEPETTQRGAGVGAAAVCVGVQLLVELDARWLLRALEAEPSPLEPESCVLVLSALASVCLSSVAAALASAVRRCAGVACHAQRDTDVAAQGLWAELLLPLLLRQGLALSAPTFIRGLDQARSAPLRLHADAADPAGAPDTAGVATASLGLCQECVLSASIEDLCLGELRPSHPALFAATTSEVSVWSLRTGMLQYSTPIKIPIKSRTRTTAPNRLLRVGICALAPPLSDGGGDAPCFVACTPAMGVRIFVAASGALHTANPSLTGAASVHNAGGRFVVQMERRAVICSSRCEVLASVDCGGLLRGLQVWRTPAGFVAEVTAEVDNNKINLEAPTRAFHVPSGSPLAAAGLAHWASDRGCGEEAEGAEGAWVGEGRGGERGDGEEAEELAAVGKSVAFRGLLLCARGSAVHAYQWTSASAPVSPSATAAAAAAAAAAADSAGPAAAASAEPWHGLATVARWRHDCGSAVLELAASDAWFAAWLGSGDLLLFAPVPGDVRRGRSLGLGLGDSAGCVVPMRLRCASLLTSASGRFLACRGDLLVFAGGRGSRLGVVDVAAKLRGLSSPSPASASVESGGESLSGSLSGGHSGSGGGEASGSGSQATKAAAVSGAVAAVCFLRSGKRRAQGGVVAAATEAGGVSIFALDDLSRPLRHLSGSAGARLLCGVSDDCEPFSLLSSGSKLGGPAGAREGVVAVACARSIRLYDVASGHLTESMVGFPGAVTVLISCRRSSGASQLVSGSSRGSITSWSPRTGQMLTTCAGHRSPIAALAVFVLEPDTGKEALVSCAQAELAVNIWDLDIGVLLGVVPDCPAPVAMCSFYDSQEESCVVFADGGGMVGRVVEHFPKHDPPVPKRDEEAGQSLFVLRVAPGPAVEAEAEAEAGAEEEAEVEVDAENDTDASSDAGSVGLGAGGGSSASWLVHGRLQAHTIAVLRDFDVEPGAEQRWARLGLPLLAQVTALAPVTGATLVAGLLDGSLAELRLTPAVLN